MDPPKCFTKQVCDFSAADVEGYNNYLKNFNFDNFFTNQYCVDEICEQLTSTILAAAKQFIPNGNITVRPSDKAFYKRNLRHLKHLTAFTNMLKVLTVLISGHVLDMTEMLISKKSNKPKVNILKKDTTR